MSLKYAVQLQDIYQAFRQEPIKAEDLAQFYRDATIARGEPTRKKIRNLLLRDMTQNKHILFVGYQGCGKSTELNYLEQDIKDDFLTINFSIRKELDPLNVQYVELVILTMEQLFQSALDNDIKIRQSLLDSVERWAGSREITDVKERFFSTEDEMGGGIDIKYFINFFSKLKIVLRNGGSFKDQLKQTIEPRISDLMAHCNALIAEIRLKLDTIGKKDLLLIYEDLDKVKIENAKELFYSYAGQLTQLRINVIYTFPIALYSTKINEIKPFFEGGLHELPMIKVHEKNGSDHHEGMQIMRDIVHARMDIGLFADAQPASDGQMQSELLDRMIRKSGGVIRDLFLLVGEAASNADVYDRDKITEADWTRAYQRLKKDYSNSIADERVDGELYTVEAYFKVLVDLSNSSDKLLENKEEVFHLRQNLCILGYNGENWYDVHPIIKDILQERKLIS